MSEHRQRARVTNVTVKRPMRMIDQAEEKPRRGERLSRNCAVVGLALIFLLGIRNAKLPSGQTIMAAVREITDADWTDGLGRITFVSALFPETAAVFFDQSPALSLPCLGSRTHAWRSDEPYLAYQTTGAVKAALHGTVSSIGHGDGEERIVRLKHENGYETVYYNLESTPVSIGDPVGTGDVIGVPLDQTVYFEVKRDGLSVDPSPLLPGDVL